MLFPSRRRALWPFIVVPLCLFLLLRGQLTSNTADYETDLPAPAPNDGSGRDVFPTRPDRSAAARFIASQKLRDFWNELHGALTADNIGVTKLEVKEPGISKDYVDPNSGYEGERQRENHVDISIPQMESMSAHIEKFKSSIDPLAKKLPYWKDSRGIVMPGGGKYTHIALTSLLLLRRTGSKLPVQVFVDTHEEYDAELCEKTFARLNAECLVLEDLVGKGTVKQYQYKVLSILLSPFQHVLFLDADAWPIYDPTYLFENEPYTTHGLITWPDFWVSTASPRFFEITKTTNEPVMTRRSSESGILMYNKAMHTESLLLATYYNWYGPGIYYTLLTQGTHGEGDKETFLHAALGMDKPFYNVKEKNGIIGRHLNGSFIGAAMTQHDPVDDNKLWRHLQEHGEPKKDKDDKVVQALPLFIHHNLWKIDLFDLGDDLSPIHKLNEEGKQTRVWGDQKDLFKRAGFDIEEMMFRVMIDAKCNVVHPPEECVGLRNYYRKIFQSGMR